MTQPVISNKTRLFEIFAVLLTAAGKFIFMDLSEWRIIFIASVISFWTIYIYYKNKRSPHITRYWGFRTDNFKKVILTILPFGIATLIICIIIGFYLGTIQITWHIIPLLVLYPIWGTIQQFLVIGLVAGNLKDFEGQHFKKGFIIVICALLFGGIHYPYLWLVAGTFALAIFYGFIYLKEKNIYALGIFHGWLGAVFFYTIVDRDPFIETFGRLFYLK